MACDYYEFADDVLVHRTATLEVETLLVGKGSRINAHARVTGTRVHIGRECWIDEYATIGGGSAFDAVAFLSAGDWLHMGNYSQINTARGVTLGNEVGIGINTRIFTHGAYLSEWEGFPVSFSAVTIGSQVWMPNAQVNPGVTIGDNVVIGASSLVTGPIPSGSFAAGTPAKVIKENAYPKCLDADKQLGLLQRLCDEIHMLTNIQSSPLRTSDGLIVDDTTFLITDRTIIGPTTKRTEAVKNQLRRHGIRFRYEERDGVYQRWS